MGQSHSSIHPQKTMDTTERVGAILLYRNKLLVVHQSSGKWGFPKGHRKFHETSLQGAIREVQEETGIDLEGIEPLACVKLIHGTYYVYNFKFLPVPTLQSSAEGEITEIAWLNYQHIRHLDKNIDLSDYFRKKKKGLLNFA